MSLTKSAKNITALVTDAPVVWNVLKGVLCVYKPAEYSVRRLRTTLINKLVTELNELQCRPIGEYKTIEPGNSPEEQKIVVKPNLADHPLVVGPRYQEQDLVVSWSNFLGYNTSGVLVFGIKSGTYQAKYLRENRSTRAYRIKGTLGQATENCWFNGKTVERSTWKHVKRRNMEMLLSAMQASHQKKMFENCGVDMQSETAYELAVQGLIRPVDSKIPIIYGLKCIEFDGPHFTLEIQCINEYETYLAGLIHEIGLKLHSTAHCNTIQCIRHSRFTLEKALLMKHWTLQNILDNMAESRKIMREHGDILRQKSARLV